MSRLDEPGRLELLRQSLARGDRASQEQLDDLARSLSRTSKADPGDETFAIVDSQGDPLGVYAPRWLCHLLGLRHKSAHLLLTWRSPSLGDVFVLQVRHWTNPHYPAHVDISVGGHVLGDNTSLDTIQRETAEELGLTDNHLVGGSFTYEYGYENFEVAENDTLHDAEWRQVYSAAVNAEAISNIRFSDQEVVGLYLCPRTQAKHLLNQQRLPLASALRGSLPYFLTNV